MLLYGKLRERITGIVSIKRKVSVCGCEDPWVDSTENCFGLKYLDLPRELYNKYEVWSSSIRDDAVIGPFLLWYKD